MDETITNLVINNKKYFEENIIIVSLHELMFEYEIFDEVRDKETNIKWIKGSEQQISNIDYLLLNRVLYVPMELFSNFKQIDREYAQRELEAYIGFSFNAFSGVGNQLPNGSCVDSISLPQQWNRITKKFTINVPNFYWGPQNNNCLDNQDILVYSKIYNYLHWSINSRPTEENHVFCFEKPQGQPVFILSIGNQQLITSDLSLSDEIKDHLKKLAGSINKYFNHFISEILIFIDGINLNFGCINPEIIRSNKNKEFDSFVCNNLISEFYKCMN